MLWKIVKYHLNVRALMELLCALILGCYFNFLLLAIFFSQLIDLYIWNQNLAEMKTSDYVLDWP